MDCHWKVVDDTIIIRHMEVMKLLISTLLISYKKGSSSLLMRRADIKRQASTSYFQFMETRRSFLKLLSVWKEVFSCFRKMKNSVCALFILKERSAMSLHFFMIPQPFVPAISTSTNRMTMDGNWKQMQKSVTDF